MRQLPFHGPGGPSQLWIADFRCGLKNKGPKKSEIHNSKSEMGRPMLFTQKLLAPGPQPEYPGIVKL
jgi:hypothetical protein